MIKKFLNYLIKDIKMNYKFYLILIFITLLFVIKLDYYIYSPGSLIDLTDMLSISPVSSNGRIYYNCDGGDTYYKKAFTEVENMVDTRKQITGKRERRAVDAFLLSFALMGMNSPDLYSCSAPIKGVITYIPLSFFISNH